MKNEYIIVKLITGEQIMSLKTGETDTSISLLYPMCINIYPRQDADGTIKEVAVASPFCHFVEEPTFTINKNHIIFNNKLSEECVQYYVDLVDQYVDIEINKAKEQSTDTTELNDQSTLDEDLMSRIVVGNDTIH